MSLNKLREIVKDREGWNAAVHGITKNRHNLATEQQRVVKHKHNKRKRRRMKLKKNQWINFRREDQVMEKGKLRSGGSDD